MTETAAQGATPTESYGNFGLSGKHLPQPGETDPPKDLGPHATLPLHPGPPFLYAAPAITDKPASRQIEPTGYSPSQGGRRERLSPDSGPGGARTPP